MLLIKISLHCTDCRWKIYFPTKICRNLPVFYRQMLSSYYKLSYYFWEHFTRKCKIVLIFWEKVLFLIFLANRSKRYRKSYFRSEGENNFLIINLSIQIFFTSLSIILEERWEYNSPSSHWEKILITPEWLRILVWNLVWILVLFDKHINTNICK